LEGVKDERWGSTKKDRRTCWKLCRGKALKNQTCNRHLSRREPESVRAIPPPPKKGFDRDKLKINQEDQKVLVKVDEKSKKKLKQKHTAQRGSKKANPAYDAPCG